jgi:hypothetical protein
VSLNVTGIATLTLNDGGIVAVTSTAVARGRTLPAGPEDYVDDNGFTTAADVFLRVNDLAVDADPMLWRYLAQARRQRRS